MTRKAVVHVSIMTLVFLSSYAVSVSAQVKGSAGKYNNCVVKIITPNETGAGIVIGTKDGDIFILTAYHVVKDAHKIGVALFAKRYAESPADAIKFNEDLDVAVIRIRSNDQFPTIQWRKDLRLKEKITIIGHPADLDWQFESEEIVRLESQDDSRKFLYSSPAVRRGVSGGGVFDENWALLGMTLGRGPSGLAIAVTSNSLVNLLETWGIPRSYLTAVQDPRIQSPYEPGDIGGTKDNGYYELTLENAKVSYTSKNCFSGFVEVSSDQKMVAVTFSIRALSLQVPSISTSEDVHTYYVLDPEQRRFEMSCGDGRYFNVSLNSVGGKPTAKTLTVEFLVPRSAHQLKFRFSPRVGNAIVFNLPSST